MSQDAPVLAGSMDNFDQLVIAISRKGPVLVDFWASWVGPSMRQQALLVVLDMLGPDDERTRRSHQSLFRY